MTYEMSALRPEEILERHGWHCPLEEFWEILDARIRSESNRDPQKLTQGYASENDEVESSDKAKNQDANRTTRTVQGDMVPRDTWGPRQRTVVSSLMIVLPRGFCKAIYRWYYLTKRRWRSWRL